MLLNYYISFTYYASLFLWNGHLLILFFQLLLLLLLLFFLIYIFIIYFVSKLWWYGLISPICMCCRSITMSGKMVMTGNFSCMHYCWSLDFIYELERKKGTQRYNVVQLYGPKMFEGWQLHHCLLISFTFYTYLYWWLVSRHTKRKTGKSFWNQINIGFFFLWLSSYIFGSILNSYQFWSWIWCVQLEIK